MQDIDRRRSPAELSIDGKISGINKVTDPDFGSDGLLLLIDATIGRNLRMAIDKPGCHVTATAVNDMS